MAVSGTLASAIAVGSVASSGTGSFAVTIVGGALAVSAVVVVVGDVIAAVVVISCVVDASVPVTSAGLADVATSTCVAVRASAASGC